MNDDNDSLGATAAQIFNLLDVYSLRYIIRDHTNGRKVLITILAIN